MLVHGIIDWPFLVLSILERCYPFLPITSVSWLPFPWIFPKRNQQAQPLLLYTDLSYLL